MTAATADSGALDGVTQSLVNILTDMTSDWDLEFDGQIGPATRLIGDLAFDG